jgi:hypothetical protein
VKYSDIPSASRPLPRGPGISVPLPPVNTVSSSTSSTETSSITLTESFSDNGDRNIPKPLSQAELNDLTRDLCLSKESSQLLGSRLRENHLLAPDTTFVWYREREREFRPFFTMIEDSGLVYCNNVCGLIETMGLTYNSTEWRLFIDSSSRSLKAVLLNNGN